MKYLILAFSIALAIGTVAFAAETPTTHPSDGMPAIERPQIPDRTFSVKDFAAAGDGKTFDTATIQKAVNACHTAGGGVVLVPAGRYLIAPIHLYSSMNLHLDKDATLLITDDTSKFKLSEKSGFECCIVADDCTDLALTGQGTIDGQGAMWWQHYVAPKTLAPGATAPPHRPYMVRLDGINRLLVQGITFRNSPSFHLALGMCQNVTIEDAHFIAEAGSHNTDGIDPSGWNYLITRCTFDVYDDCIAIKPTHQIDKSKPSCMNFLITDCQFRHGHGLSIGGGSSGGMKHMIVRDCTFDQTDAGIRMKSSRDNGGVVEDLLYENITMSRVKIPIFITSYYPTLPKNLAADPAQPITDRTPWWRHIRINNVTIKDSPIAGRIIGLAEAPVSDLVFSNVHISAEKGMEIMHANAVRFENCSVQANTGKPFNLTDVTVEGIDVKTGR